ncbi:hypothetical protein BH18GEM1_BH18GEM1_06830 [soil metagenome]
MTNNGAIRERPLFIVGFPRSGTTLLRALLGAHSCIRQINEPEIFRGLRSAGYGIGDSIPLPARASLLDRIEKIGPCQRHLQDVPTATLDRFLQDESDLTFKATYEMLLPKPTDVSIWGEKSLGNSFHVEDIFSVYPDALIVHPVRDPRATILSYYNKRHSDPISLKRRSIRFFSYQSMRWSMWAGVTRQQARTAGRSLLMVRFEDLLKDPAGTLGGICDSLGVSFDPQMLGIRHRQRDPVLDRPAAEWHKLLGEEIDPRRASSGGQLPDWARLLVERFSLEEMKLYGYITSLPRPAWHERVRIDAELMLTRDSLHQRLEKERANRLWSEPPAALESPS